ncbi:MAG: PilN domain-containing protein [Alphaproteobacteria bacterium]|nr:PilN domain-containing protein [Alphaproteobacteria bacterium]
MTAVRTDTINAVLARCGAWLDVFAGVPQREAARPVVSVKGDDVALHGGAAMGEVAHGSRSELSRMVRGRDVIVLVPEADVLRAPCAIRASGDVVVRRALRYEVERLCPVDPATLYFDFIRRPSGLEIRMVRKSAIDEAVAACRGAGLAVAAIHFAADEPAADHRSFPVDKAAHLRWLARRFRHALLAATAAALLCAAVLGLYLRQAVVLDGLSGARAEAELRAARVDAMGRQADGIRRDLSRLAASKEGPFLVDLLADLTAVLPDGTWVTQLVMDGGRVRIQGGSTRATDLIALIDRAPHFANARFEAPLVHDTTAGVDRFDLSFEARRGS